MAEENKNIGGSSDKEDWYFDETDKAWRLKKDFTVDDRLEETARVNDPKNNEEEAPIEEPLLPVENDEEKPLTIKNKKLIKRMGFNAINYSELEEILQQSMEENKRVEVNIGYKGAVIWVRSGDSIKERIKTIKDRLKEEEEDTYHDSRSILKEKFLEIWQEK